MKCFKLHKGFFLNKFLILNHMVSFYQTILDENYSVYSRSPFPKQEPRDKMLRILRVGKKPMSNKFESKETTITIKHTE